MTHYERKPREAKLPAVTIDKLPKRIRKPVKVKLTDVKSTPIKHITRADLMRKNHEAFHFEKDDYKITVRYEYIEDVGRVHRISYEKSTPISLTGIQEKPDISL